MHITKLSLINYRNFKNAKVLFHKGTNTILGENGSGKTNLFRAMRLLLDDNMIRSSYRMEENDFHRGLGRWQGHWIIISMEFAEISADEAMQALFVHGAGVLTEGPINRATYNLIFRPRVEIRLRLSQLEPGDKVGLEEILSNLTIADYEAKFTGRSDVDFNNDAVYQEVVGDFENAIFSKEVNDPRVGLPLPQLLSVQKEISFTFIQALRDVVSDFKNNRTNPLFTLLKYKSGEVEASKLAPITAQVKALNASIEELDDVKEVRTDIAKTIKEAAGETYSPTSLSIKSDLSDEASELFQSLKLYIGESDKNYEGDIYELSLGGANLIYLTLKLLEFKYQRQKESFANFLLIEEPEAHLHTHIQKTLFDRINYDNTQIIYSTHSTQISEVSNVENINVLGRKGGNCEVYQPSSGLSPTEVRAVQRYLDAVRNNLLFAKSVLLVEGDAEEILIPILIKKVFGLSLDELGISLINIRSTGFQNVAHLFHDARIRKKCAIITDLDSSIIDIGIVEGDTDTIIQRKKKYKRSQESGAARKVALTEFIGKNPWIGAYFAHHTFEVDLLLSGNVTEFELVTGSVYSDEATKAIAKSDIQSSDISLSGVRVLTMATYEGKGWFAILLGDVVDVGTVIPHYILQALVFASPIEKVEIWVSIFSYRIMELSKCGVINDDDYKKSMFSIHLYEIGKIDLAGVYAEFEELVPGDQVIQLISMHLP